MYGNNSFRQNIRSIIVSMHKRAIPSLTFELLTEQQHMSLLIKKFTIDNVKKSHFRCLAERENEFHENRKLNDQYVTLCSIRILH